MDEDLKPGDIRIIDGRRMRFIERELEGEKWEPLDEDEDLKLVDQLLFEATAGHMTSVTRDVMAEAAATITRLHADNARLREALDAVHGIARFTRLKPSTPPTNPHPRNLIMDEDLKPGDIRIIDGRRMRFIERELEGEKWEPLDGDDDLKLVGDLKAWSHYMGDGDVSPAPDATGDAVLSIVLDHAAATITRLHAEITQMTNTIDGLEFLNAKLMKERDEALRKLSLAMDEDVKMSALMDQERVLMATEARAETTEAQRDAALEELRAIKKAAEADWVDVPRKPKAASRTLDTVKDKT